MRPWRLPAKRRASRAERLSWLESEDARISRALHELTRKRQQYQQEARTLRVALTAEDRALYDALRSMRATDGRRPDPARLVRPEVVMPSM